MLIELLQEGLFFVNKPGFVDNTLTKNEIALIETGISRYEDAVLKREVTDLERQLYYSAFCSAFTVAGEIMRK